MSSKGRKKRHPVGVPYSRLSNRDLGRTIARLRYDALLEVLAGMHDELSAAQSADTKRGYAQLARKAREATKHLAALKGAVNAMFLISFHHMRHEFESGYNDQHRDSTSPRL